MEWWGYGYGIWWRRRWWRAYWREQEGGIITMIFFFLRQSTTTTRGGGLRHPMTCLLKAALRSSRRPHQCRISSILPLHHPACLPMPTLHGLHSNLSIGQPLSSEGDWAWMLILVWFTRMSRGRLLWRGKCIFEAVYLTGLKKVRVGT